ncbi:MAG: SRPBCC family protein [Bacteroidales bacterium]|nr:SRPBCC family protein [Bacteroidales bacterium]
MKLLKIAFWFVVIILVFIFVIPLFLPDNVQIEAKTNIKASPETVFRQLNSLKNWSNWSTWNQADSAMTVSYSGPDFGEGAVFNWKSKVLGNGQIKIVNSLAYSSVRNELDLGERGRAEDEWVFKKLGDSIQVTWNFRAINLRYPLGKLNGLFLSVTMKSFQLEELAGLRDYCQKQPLPVSVNFIEVKPAKCISIADSATYTELSAKMEAGFTALFKKAEAQKGSITGAPFALYYNWDTAEQIHYRLGLPIMETKQLACDFTQEGGKALMAVMKGSYDQFERYHNEIQLFAMENNLQFTGAPWEEYISGPGNTEDAANWETRIYYPVK